MFNTNALSLIITQHKKLKKILNLMSKTSEKANKKRTLLLEKLVPALQVHQKSEEIIFYPAIEDKKNKDIILEAFQEHHVIDNILEELQNTSPDHETWAPKLKVLTENIEHHFKEEEENLFPKVKKIMNKTELNLLGKKMQAFQKDNKIKNNN